MNDYIRAEEYMSQFDLNQEDFSDYINNYLLDHRYQDGELFVKSTPPPREDIGSLSLEDMIANKTLGELPPLPKGSGNKSDTQKDRALSTDLITMSQVSMFKDENKEILKFSEKSLTTMANYTQTIFRDKERIIDMKDKQIEELQRIILQKEDTIRSLRRQTDDFHILTDALTHSIKKK